LAGLACAANISSLRGEAQVQRSLVRIVNYSQKADWYSPWASAPTQQGMGSGFVIDGGLVMTNAHVVSDARMLLLYLHGDPTPHEARVASIAHDCDLALLEPVEAGLLEGLPTLKFWGLPKLGSMVETWLNGGDLRLPDRWSTALRDARGGLANRSEPVQPLGSGQLSHRADRCRDQSGQ
jgi:hypothetical protein